MNRFFLIILCCLYLSEGITQVTVDTIPLPKGDSIRVAALPDTQVSRRPALYKIADSIKIIPGSVSFHSPRYIQEVLAYHSYFNFKQKPSSTMPAIIHNAKGKELIFYVLVFLLILFAILRQAFSKYFADLFRLFFRTTLKQRQIKEQLVQTPLPSLLLNIFFVITGGFYLALIIQYYRADPVNDLWLLSAYCCGGLAIAYLVKYLWLKIAGWLFGKPEVADAYIFIVFIVNKVIGILLLPFIILLAFTSSDVQQISLFLSYILLAGMMGYRIILTYGAIHNKVKVNLFHFVLYFLAFELAPLLLVYKGLLLFFGIST